MKRVLIICLVLTFFPIVRPTEDNRIVAQEPKASSLDGPLPGPESVKLSFSENDLLAHYLDNALETLDMTSGWRIETETIDRDQLRLILRQQAMQLLKLPSTNLERVAPGLKIPRDASDANVGKVNSENASKHNQTAGGSVISWVEHRVLVSESHLPPRLPWAENMRHAVKQIVRSMRRPTDAPTLSHSHHVAHAYSSNRIVTSSIQTTTAAATPKAIFVATGRSSGAAFEMTLVHEGPERAELVDPGFVLEPVQGVSADDARREIGKVKGRRVTAIIDAYCMQMRKPPPAAGMVYRLAKNAIQKQNAHLGPIMAASKLLQVTGRLRPDTNPAQYFHTIRQWALWTHEQGFKSEGDFANAFIEHSRKNVAAVGRQWTPELEQSVRRLLPNRWRDITEVLKLALPTAPGGR